MPKIASGDPWADDHALAPLAPLNELELGTGPSHSLPAAACKGGLAAGVPALVLTSIAPLLFEGVFPSIFQLLRETVPLLAPYLSLGILFMAPALLALPTALVARRMVARLARRDRDQGLAAAAGAGLATTAVTFGAILSSAGSLSETVVMAPLFTAAALAAGVVGVASFSAVPAPGGRDRDEEPVPSLYYGLIAAGVGGPALLAGGAAWSMAASIFPFLSPKILENFLMSPLAEAATVTLALAGLAPVSFLTARAFRNAFRRARKGAVAAGLMFPPLVPLIVLLGFFLSRGEMTLSLVGLLGGCLAGAATHGLAIALGLRDGSSAPRARLPDGEGPVPELSPAPAPGGK